MGRRGAVALATRPVEQRGSIPHLEQLFGRGHGLLSSQGGRVACGCILGGSKWSLLCKRLPCLFPLYTATVVHCVVTTTATALKLFTRG